MSEKEEHNLFAEIAEIKKMIISNRDTPPSETISKLFYAMQGDLKVHTEILERIEAQTVKTNGRVTRLEERVEDIKLWRENLKGKIVAISSIVSFVMILIGWGISLYK